MARDDAIAGLTGKVSRVSGSNIGKIFLCTTFKEIAEKKICVLDAVLLGNFWQLGDGYGIGRKIPPHEDDGRLWHPRHDITSFFSG